jgi:hypothetical protein
VVEAVREQAGRMLHSSTRYLVEPQIALAEEIAKLSGIPNPKVFFTNSGSEANDTALMLATACRRSNQVLAIRHSYHGRSFSAVAITTGTRSWSPSSLSPVNVSYVHGGYRLRSPFGHLPDDQLIGACVDDLRNVLEICTAGDVACMIAAATFCPAIVLSLLWRRYSVQGALASMLMGALCIPLLKFAVPSIPVWGPLVSRAEELAPSFLASLGAGVRVTLSAPAEQGVRAPALQGEES